MTPTAVEIRLRQAEKRLEVDFDDGPALVAQLDRVLPSEGRGFGFKSQRVHAYFSELNTG